MLHLLNSFVALVMSNECKLELRITDTRKKIVQKGDDLSLEKLLKQEQGYTLHTFTYVPIKQTEPPNIMCKMFDFLHFNSHIMLGSIPDNF